MCIVGISRLLTNAPRTVAVFGLAGSISRSRCNAVQRYETLFNFEIAEPTEDSNWTAPPSIIIGSIALLQLKRLNRVGNGTLGDFCHACYRHFVPIGTIHAEQKLRIKNSRQ